MSLRKIEQRHNVSLAPFTTIKIGGLAERFFTAHNKDDLEKILEECQGQFYLLGNGSNLLITDSVIKKPVIKLGEEFCQIRHNGGLLEIGAAAPVSDVTSYTLEKNLGGLENFTGIPATIGGLLAMNASAFEKDISSSLVKLEVMDKDAKVRVLEKDAIRFDYRSSSLKDSLIILRAWFNVLPDTNLKSKIDSFLKTRHATQDLEHPSCGCIFKNPPSQSAGFLIESCGLKGIKHNDVQVSNKHANFIVNLGSATYADVDHLISLIKEKVFKSCGIALQEEVERWI